MKAGSEVEVKGAGRFFCLFQRQGDPGDCVLRRPRQVLSPRDITPPGMKNAAGGPENVTCYAVN